MGFVRDKVGIDLTGGGARRAAESAARRQERGVLKGQEAIRADLAPFTDVGAEAANLLLSSVFAPTEQDPQEILQNPFFQALSRQQNQDLLQQRAALGLAGSGGTEDALNRNLLLLGNQFQQQNLNNALAQNQLRFNQLLGVSGLGQASAAQTGAAANLAQQQIGALQGVAPLARAQQQAQFTQNVLQGFGQAPGGGESGATPGIFGGGGAAGGGGGLSGLIAAGAQLFSDRRLKENIVKVDEDENGNIYEFSYTWFKGRFRGRIAQELQKLRPDAVKLHETGFMMVTPEFRAEAI